MSGGNCPETPRQKMIGMMYLFYTALLALNVSSEIVLAFVKIDDSIKKTTEAYSAKTESMYTAIANKASESKSPKYIKLNETAMEVKAKSEKLFKDIDRLKLMIIQESQGKEATLKDEIKKKDDLHAATIIMVGEGGKMMGDSLRLWMNNYSKFLLSVAKDPTSTVAQNILKNLETIDQKDNPEEPWTWQETLCRGMPMIGTLAMLSKLQADVRNAEADILGLMVSELEALDIRITSLEGLVSTSTSFVVRGGTYSSSIFLGARDTSMRPTIWVTTSEPFYDSIIENGELKYKKRGGAVYDSLPLDASGKGLYTTQCGGVGNFKYGGLVHYVSNKGDMWLPFKSAYQVGDAGFTVSATKCNVFYRGLDNPVEVAVSGYPKESVSVGISGGGSIRPAAGGGYTVNIPQGVTSREVVISVSVKTDAGGKGLGSAKFNVLNVPPATVKLGGVYADGSRVPKSAINASPYLSAKLESDFFPFEGIKYTVSSYMFKYSARGVEKVVNVSGANLNAEVLDAISRMGTGSLVSFTNISVSGPSGIAKTGGCTVTIQ